MKNYKPKHCANETIIETLVDVPLNDDNDNLFVDETDNIDMDEVIAYEK